MKKKAVLCCGVALLLLISFLTYMQTIGAPVIGTLAGPEWERLTVHETNYERVPHAPANGTDREHFLGIAMNGETRFRVYSIKGTDDYLLCMWEWVGRLYFQAGPVNSF